MKNRKLWLTVGAVAVLGLGWMVFGPKTAKAKPRTAPVERGRIVATVSATGTVTPLVQVEVGSQVSGTILKLQADYNDRVKKGQVIARLEPSLFRTAVVQAQANVARAVAGVNDAQRTLTRAKELVKRGLVAQVEVDSDQTAYEQRVAELKQAQAALGTAQVNLNHTIITAPISGVVIARAVDVGQTVAASLSAPTLFTLAEDLSHMKVETKIDESDVGRIRDGLRCTFTVDAFPNDTFEGRVSQVRLEPVTSENVVTYTTVIDVANIDNKLRPGMTANVTLITDVRPDAIKVPNAALRFRPTDMSTVVGGADAASGAGRGNASAADSTSRRGGGGGGGSWRQRVASGDTTGMAARRARWAADGGGGFGEGGGMRRGGGSNTRSQTVYVLQKDKKLKPVAVRTGITDGAYTEIVSGDLKEGDPVVVGMTGTQTAQNNLSAPPGFGGGFRGPGGGGGGRGGGGAGGGGRGGGR